MIPGKEVKIGDKTYVLPPLTLGMLEVYQDPIDEFQSGRNVSSKSWTTVINVIHDALKRNYPDAPRSVITDNLEMGNVMDIFAALMTVSGVEQNPGEVKAGQ